MAGSVRNCLTASCRSLMSVDPSMRTYLAPGHPLLSPSNASASLLITSLHDGDRLL